LNDLLLATANNEGDTRQRERDGDSLHDQSSPVRTRGPRTPG
jgi:hypothetical protein